MEIRIEPISELGWNAAEVNSMRPTNLLFILSDQHSRDCSGSYGHPVVSTPHLDRLAEQGTRFLRAYTNCPICVPARASLATGRYVHQVRYWDNGIAYDGRIPSWGHRVREQGFRVDSIGKLHFESARNDNGFSEEIQPLHVVAGVGDIQGCLRGKGSFRNKRIGILEAGPGDSTYLSYDQSNADAACRWLREHQNDEKPWALFLSFVCPHPPYIAPPELFRKYPPEDVVMPPQWREADWPAHPAIDFFRRYFGFAPQFAEAEVRRMIAAYYGVCTYLDARIGEVLDCLRGLNLNGRTRIIYSSDHGEHMGARGIFGKFTHYDDAVAVPLILAGPDVPEGNVSQTPVSLVDCFPTVVNCVGAHLKDQDANLPGTSLWEIAADSDRSRTVFSEYHAAGSRNAAYMLCDGRFKFNYYVEEPPQLFDLAADPQELYDLAETEAGAGICRRFDGRLREVLDPRATDRLAKQDQLARIEAFGGVEAAGKRGTFENSPVPGEDPAFKVY